MRSIITILLLSISLLGAGRSTSGKVREFENSIRETVEKSLARFLGPTAEYVVTARARVAQSGEESMDASPVSGEYLDLGYVNVPFSFQGSDTEVPVSTDIAGVEVEVILADTTDPKVMLEAQKLVQSTLKGYDAQVKINTVKFPEFSDRQPASVAEKLTGSDAKSAFDFFWLLIGVGAVAAAFAGLWFLSSSLRKGFEAIGAGLSSMKASASASEAPKEAIQETLSSERKVETSREIEKSQEKTKQAPTALARPDHDRNMEVIKGLLDTDPIALLKALSDGEDDLQGGRWFFTQLGEAQRVKFRKFVGETRMKKMQEISHSIYWEPSNWLQSWLERITLIRMRGRGSVERALGPDQMLELYGIDSRLLENAMGTTDARGAWRIASEMLPPAALSDLLKKGNENVWGALFDSAAVAPDEIQKGFEEIQKSVVEVQKKTGTGTETAVHFEKVLLNPVVEAVKSLPLGEDDKLLEHMAIKNPELVNLVRNRVWTPKMLTRISSEVLMPFIDALDTDQTFAVIIGFPEPWSEKFAQSIPLGRKRDIVMDLVERARRNPDERGLRSARAVCRGFLEQLRKMNAAGRLKLIEEKPAEVAVAAPTDPQTPPQTPPPQSPPENPPAAA